MFDKWLLILGKPTEDIYTLIMANWGENQSITIVSRPVGPRMPEFSCSNWRGR